MIESVMHDKCQVCGRRLYTERSRRIGIGPVCLKNTMTKIEVAQLLARFTDIEEVEEARITECGAKTGEFPYPECCTMISGVYCQGEREAF